MTELKTSQGLSDVSCFVGIVVRVGSDWALNMKSLHIRNIVIVINRDANKKNPPNVFDIKAVWTFCVLVSSINIFTVKSHVNLG